MKQTVRLVLLLIARTALRGAMRFHFSPVASPIDRKALIEIDSAIRLSRHYDVPRFLRAKGWR